MEKANTNSIEIALACPHREICPTNDYSLDVDMIIAAHWQLLKEEFPNRYLVIGTTNVKHLSQFAEALNWENIQL